MSTEAPTTPKAGKRNASSKKTSGGNGESQLKPSKSVKADRAAKLKLVTQDSSLSSNEPPAGVAAPSKIKIFQIHFKGEQAEHLDDAFEHYDNQGVMAETQEFEVFNKLYDSTQTKGLAHWGAVSWRFTEKTGLTGQALLDQVAAHPDVDVFYMNPYPYNEALFQSVWMQGETTHPDFLSIAEQFLMAAGFNADEVLRIDNSASVSTCNYCVGSPAFWQLYIPFIEGVLKRAEAKLPRALRARIHSPEADVKSLHHGSTYIPFIVERLFAVFMRSEGRGLKARKIPLPAQEAKLNEHLRSLRMLKDAAVAGKSKVLYAIWANYRNLYCQAAFKPYWTQKYLKTLNPKEVVW